jgi:hypothetical protein
MIMLNLFIGIIMNSMAEMHAEIEEQKQFKQAALTKDPILDSLKGLDNQLTAIKSQILEIHSKLANGKS